MTEQDVANWLDRYGSAWESADPEAASGLFTEDALYQEGPFDPPARGRDGVRDYWAEATGTQRDISFRHEILAVTGDRALVRWWASFVRIRTGARFELEGILMLDFDAAGSCRELREWWHGREHPADAA